MHKFPPDYTAVIKARMVKLKKLKQSTAFQKGAKAYYKNRPVEFINDWCVTYDPRNALESKPTKMPFITFERQDEMLLFLKECVEDQESGLIEKCRDVGATWLCCGFSIWMWLYVDGSSVGWGSRKEGLVDRLGDMDSIFEKMRYIIHNLPRCFWPVGFNPDENCLYMKIINPETGNSITGEAGDNIGRGGRKAQPLDAKVLTPSGWVLMGEIKAGMFAVGSDGKKTRVLSVAPQGVKEIFKVKFSDGTETECCDDHLWQVTTSKIRKSISRKPKNHRSPKSEVLPLSVIRKNIIIKRKDGQTEYQYQIPLVSKVKFRKKKLPIHAYVMGALLGDGSFRNLNKTSVMFSSIDEELIDKVGTLLPEGLELRHSSRCDYRIIDRSIKRGRSYKNRLKETIRSLNLANLKSEDKFIPDCYKFSNVDDRLSLLQGLMDTDGWIIVRGKNNNSQKVCFASSSKQLAEDVIFLVQSIGGIASMSVKKTTHLDSYNLIISMPDGENPFSLSRKADLFCDRKKYKPRRSIVSVEPAGGKPAQCILVDNDDGLYVTDDFIVTHNTIYFKDESAFYERAEKIEAALSENTNVQIDFSSVPEGTNNVFTRKRRAGVIWQIGKKIERGKNRIFIFDWRDHPNKTQEWYNRKRQKAEDEGLLHIFAREVDRDPASSVDNVLIPKPWIEAAVDAHEILKFEAEGMVFGSLDIADEGKDKTALGVRKGVVVIHLDQWPDPDVGESTRRTVPILKMLKVGHFKYDSVGMGSGVKSELNRLKGEKVIPKNMIILPFNAGGKVVKPNERVIKGDKESPKNKDFYSKINAQGGWALRRRFEKTYKSVVKGEEHDVDELISLPSDLPYLAELKDELSQPTFSHKDDGKLTLIKKPKGETSPNLFDVIMMLYCPIEEKRKVLI